MTKLAPPPCAQCELPEGVPLLAGAVHTCGTCGMLWLCGWHHGAWILNTPPERAKRLRELARGRA